MDNLNEEKVIPLSIVTVHYKDPFIFKTIESVFKTVKTPFEYIVIDNQGDEEEWQRIIKQFPQCTFIQNPKPYGYARGMNVGLRKANGKFVLPLNPDILVSEGAIDKMLAYLKQNPEVVILGPKLLNADKSLQYSCRRYPKLSTMLFRRGLLKNIITQSNTHYEMHDFNHKEIKEVDWLCGGFLLMRQEHLRKIGFFDEWFFLYFDDVDFCRRAHKFGKVVYYPEVEAIHNAAYESKTKLIPFLIHLKSMFYYFLKCKFFPDWYFIKWKGWCR